MRQILRKIPGYELGKKVYHFSGRLRKRLQNKINQTARILLYHRVAELENDPYLLAVSPENFRTQLEYLKNNFRVVPLAQLVEELRTKKLTNHTIAITFDDGYSDNWQNAAPILKELNLPATFFITTNHITKALSNGVSKSNSETPLLSAELYQLAATPGFEIGSHTLTHPRLSKISPEEQEKEILESKKQLEAMLNIPITGFAYPYGDEKSYNQDTINLVKKTGYRYACANIHERVKKDSDIYVLPRYVVRNWDLEEFKKEMENFI